MEQTQNIKIQSRIDFTKAVLEVAAGSFLLALSAQAAIHIPFSPVPCSLQTAALFLLSAFLGPKKAFYAVLAYLGEGAVGLPVFAEGMGGIAALVGPRAGYLAGFALAAWISGNLTRNTASFTRLAASFALGEGAILVLGFTWLSLWVGPLQAFTLGVAPFLFGDALKILAAAAFVKGARKIRA